MPLEGSKDIVVDTDALHSLAHAREVGLGRHVIDAAAANQIFPCVVMTTSGVHHYTEEYDVQLTGIDIRMEAAMLHPSFP